MSKIAHKVSNNFVRVPSIYDGYTFFELHQKNNIDFVPTISRKLIDIFNFHLLKVSTRSNLTFETTFEVEN